MELGGIKGQGEREERREPIKEGSGEGERGGEWGGNVDLCSVGISNFTVYEPVGKLAPSSLHSGSARLLKGMNTKSVRLTCTSQPTDSSTVKLEIPTENPLYKQKGGCSWLKRGRKRRWRGRICI